MGPPSYMRSVVDRNVVMRRIPAHLQQQRETKKMAKIDAVGPPPLHSICRRPAPTPPTENPLMHPDPKPSIFS